MRVFIANGAPRKNGVTQEILKYLSLGIKDAGGEVDRVDLRRETILPCTGCFSCWNVNTKRPCVLKDNTHLLLERFRSADTVVFASPLYFYSFSSMLKGFQERLMPLTRPKLTRGATLGITQNSRHEPEIGPQRSVLVCVAAHRDPRIFEGVTSSFSMLSDALGLEPAGVLLRPESFFFDFSKRRQNDNRTVPSALKEAGRQIVREGKISRDIERAVAVPLTRSSEEYARHFENYWQIAFENGLLGGEDKRIRRAVDRDMRSLMPSLERAYNPKTTENLEAVFVFELGGDQPGTWSVEIHNGICRVESKHHEKPNVTIKTTSNVLNRILTGSLDIRFAMGSGRLLVEGDKSLFKMFGRIFSN